MVYGMVWVESFELRYGLGFFEENEELNNEELIYILGNYLTKFKLNVKESYNFICHEHFWGGRRLPLAMLRCIFKLWKQSCDLICMYLIYFV